MTATAISLLTPTEKLSPVYHRHLEQRTEGSESTGSVVWAESAVRPKSVVRPAKAMKLWLAKIR